MGESRHLVVRWMVGGAVSGFVWPIVAFVIAATHVGTWSIVEVHASQPVLWAVDLAPLVMAAIGGLIGAAHSHLSALREETHRIAERMAEELDAEIHDSNVGVARTAQLQTKFFAALSHDMKTPLSAIIGFSELADDMPETDRKTMLAYMQDIHTCANQLLGIVNDLMDAAKLGSGRVELQVSDVDGDEVAAQAVRHLTPLAEEEELILFTDLRASRPVRADRQRLRQILVNLISNAIKYTDKGSVLVRSRAQGDRILYEVVDTGAGVSESDMPLLFRPFEQTAVGKFRTDSTGLGLPVSLGLAEAMGGTIEVESDGVGFGTTFRLVLQRGSGGEAELCMATLPALAA